MKYIGQKNIELFLDFLKKNNHGMKPISEKELERIELLANGQKLPDDYLQFMKKAGNGIEFLRGSSYTMQEIGKLKNGAIELLEEDESDEALSDNDFVFFMHQGYQFYFFRLDEFPNPAIYYYGEGENSARFIYKYDSLLDFLIEHYNAVSEYLYTCYNNSRLGQPKK